MRKGMRLLAVTSMLAVMLGGCGTPMYELTDEEEDLIVQSATYMLGKYNIYQKDGMNAAQPKKQEEVKDTQMNTEEETQTGDETQATNPVSGGNSSSDGEAASGGEISLAEAIDGGDSLEVTYKKYSLMDVYREGTYFSLNAGKNNTFVVLTFELKNPGSKAVKLNNFGSGSLFYLSFGSVSHVEETQTFITNSLSAYEGKIAAGETAEAVLIFEITKEQAEELTEPSLTMEKNGTSFSVNL